MTLGDLALCLPDISASTPQLVPGVQYRGYRINPQQSADNSIWFLGCSIVWGERVQPNQNLPYLLSRLTGLNFFNMGINGAGTAWVRYCVDRLVSLGHRPRSVIICWPGFNRWLSWDKEQQSPVFWAPWAVNPELPRYKIRKADYPEDQRQYKQLILEDRLESISRTDRLETLSLLSAQGIPCFEFAPYYAVEDWSKLGLKVLPEPADLADDGWHPGPVSYLKYATWLKEQLVEIGWTK